MTATTRRVAGTKNANATEAVKRLAAWLEENDTGTEAYLKYSGRFMFGATCFGIVGQMADIQTTLMDFVADHPEHARAMRELVKGQRSDSMGRDIIIYFPDVDIERDAGEAGDDGDVFDAEAGSDPA